MNNKTLFRISLIIVLVGIFFLLFMNFKIKPPLTKISEINASFLNKQIQLTGSTANIKNYNNLQILNLKDKTGRINVVFYGKNSLKNNQEIKVYGTVVKYKDSLEIQADKIELIS